MSIIFHVQQSYHCGFTLRQIRRVGEHQHGSGQGNRQDARLRVSLLRRPAQHRPRRGQLQRHEGDSRKCHFHNRNNALVLWCQFFAWTARRHTHTGPIRITALFLLEFRCIHELTEFCTIHVRAWFDCTQNLRIELAWGSFVN